MAFIFSTRKANKTHLPDCYCVTCDREIHHLGIMSHRAMHRRKAEDCAITFSDGTQRRYKFACEGEQP